MIQKQEVFILTCDNCKKQYAFDEDEFTVTLYYSEQEALIDASKSGWQHPFVNGEMKNYCLDCAKKLGYYEND